MIDREQISVRFKELYGTEPTLVSKSPGRINIIGEHTDYNEGFVLPTAIDKAVYVALRRFIYTLKTLKRAIPLN